MSEPKITKVTILWEYESGEVRGWELTGTPDVPVRLDRTWSCEPVRDYAAESGSSWAMHKPGPVTEASVSVVAGAFAHVHRPTPQGDDG